MKNLIALILLAVPIFAQDDRLDELPFDDEPLQAESKSYFAIAGGYTFNVGMINLDEVNNFFSKFAPTLDNTEYQLGELSSPLIMHGGGGFTGIPFWKNIRIGFEAWAGSAETDEVSVMNEELSLISKGEFNVAMTALHADYGFVITDGLAVLAGMKLGWSGLNMIYSLSEPNYNWETLGSDTNLNMVEIDKSWLFVAPQVSIDWAATGFLMFSLNASYNINFDNPFLDDFEKNWKINRTASLDNVPTDLNIDQLNVRLGVYLGLFNY
ncbi:hypothetical protein OAQ99_03005 [Candidatus Kapabacteria bacterium]|nr:hypothetical protein [Candidatus Kapabacteria bacterium]